MGTTKKEQMLRKVRGLLAKAEDPACTPEEAEAFSRKAEELIAAYAIDLALLQAKAGNRSKPTTVLLDTEKNYRMPYVELLVGITRAFGVRLILVDARKRVTLVGYESDLDMVQTLYASLLLQATNAVLHESRASGRRGDDLWRFKVSFLVGFAQRVAERLQAMYQQQAGSGEPGTALVLRDRRKDVNEEFARLFPNIERANGSRVRDPQGFRGGQAAGSRADLGGKRVGGTRREIA